MPSSAEQTKELDAANSDVNRTLHAVIHALPHIEKALHRTQHLNPMLQEQTMLNIEQHAISEETNFLAHLLQGALILADIHGSSVSRMNPQSAAQQSQNVLKTPDLSLNSDQDVLSDESELLDNEEADLLDDPLNKY